MIKNFNSSNKTISLYNGEIKLVFKESGHRYEIEGQEIIGVTTILKTIIAKEGIVNWAVKMTGNYILEKYQPKVYTKEELEQLVNEAKKHHRLEKEKAGTFGTDIHQWLEQYIKAKISKTDLPKLPDNKAYQSTLQSFFEWEKKGNVVFEESEKVVYSKKYNYAGTVDFIAKVNGIRIIGDIKTSNYIYPESYFLQLSAYRFALEEENKEAGIKGMLIVKVPKTKESSLEVVMVNNYEDNAKAFLYGVHLYNQITKLKNFYNNKGGEKNDTAKSN